MQSFKKISVRSLLYALRCSLSSGLRSPVTGRWSHALCLWSLVAGLLSLVSCLLSLSPANAHASEFSINPSIAISEEYNDNVFETNHRSGDFITRAMPGLAFTYLAPYWDWDLSYYYDYRYYARNSRNGDDTHNLATKGLLRLIDDFLLLDFKDNYSRVSLDISRDRTLESPFANQSDSNILAASPYLQFHPGPNSTIRSGYRYTNVWYSDPTAIDRREHDGFIDFTYAVNPRLNLSASYTYTHESSIIPFDRHAPYVGYRYEYGEKSFFFAQAGYTWIRVKDSGNFDYPFWNAGITHTIGTWSATLKSWVQYPEDPTSGLTRETDYSLEVKKELNRGSAGASIYYSNYKGTNTGPINNIPGSDIDVSNKYGAGITAKYDLTTKLTGNFNGNIERYEHRTTNSYTRRILVNPSLSYALPRDFTVALNYVFVDSYSPATPTDTYQVNRLSLELKMSFGKVLQRTPPAEGGQETGESKDNVKRPVDK